MANGGDLNSRRPLSRLLLGALAVAAGSLIIGVLVITTDDADQVNAPSNVGGPSDAFENLTTTTATPSTTTTTATTTATPSTTTTSTTTTTISAPPPSSTASTVEGLATVDLSTITRPIIDGDVCVATWGRDLPGGAQASAEFERVSSRPIAAQVLGLRSGSLADPFALVERFVADQQLPDDFTSDIDVNARPALVDWTSNVDTGSITWRLADGTEAYLRTRGFSREESLDLARSLRPRSTDLPVPGFDVDSTNTLGLSVIEETNGNIVNTMRTASECRLGNGSTITVSLIEPYTVARAAFIMNGSAGRTLLVRDLPDGRMLVLSGRGEASPGWKDVAEYTDEILTQIREATPKEWAALVLYPMPGELEALDLPVDAQAQNALADRSFSNLGELVDALTDTFQSRIPEADQPDSHIAVARLVESPRFLVTMNYLDDSTVAAQWLVEFGDRTGAFTVTSVHQAIKCRDGSAHAPGYLCV